MRFENAVCGGIGAVISSCRILKQPPCSGGFTDGLLYISFYSISSKYERMRSVEWTKDPRGTLSSNQFRFCGPVEFASYNWRC